MDAIAISKKCARRISSAGIARAIGLRTISEYWYWTLAKLSLQSFECFILLFFLAVPLHGESLLVLRIISTLYLVFSTFSILTSTPGHRMYHGVEIPDQMQGIRTSAVLITMLAATASLLLLVILHCDHSFLFSTSPIMRALIVSAIVALPLDILVTFTLFQAVAARRYFVLPRSRWFSLYFQAIALIPLACGCPLLYLATSLVPRFWNAQLIFREITTYSFSKAFRELCAVPQSAYALLRNTGKGNAGAILFLAAFEFSFYRSFSFISKMTPEYGILVFAAHKGMHLSSLFMLRFIRRIDSQGHILRAFGTKQRGCLLRNLAGTCLASSLITLPFILLFVVRYSAETSLNPYGEALSLQGWLMPIGLVCFSIRTLALVAIPYIMKAARDSAVSIKKILPSVLLCLGSTFVSLFFARTMNTIFDTDTVIAIFFLAESLLTVAALVGPLIPSIIKPLTLPIAQQRFFKALFDPTKGEKMLLHLEVHPDIHIEIFKMKLSNLLPSDASCMRFGARDFLILFNGITKAIARQKFVAELGPYLSQALSAELPITPKVKEIEDAFVSLKLLSDANNGRSDLALHEISEVYDEHTAEYLSNLRYEEAWLGQNVLRKAWGKAHMPTCNAQGILTIKYVPDSNISARRKHHLTHLFEYLRGLETNVEQRTTI